MNRQLTLSLDPRSFEQLLAAAWVLQCQREQESREAGDSRPAVPSSIAGELPRIVQAAWPDKFQEPAPVLSILPAPDPIATPSEIAAVPLRHQEAEAVISGAGKRKVVLPIAMVVMEPFLVLLIMAVFLLTEPWDHSPAQASETKTPPPVIQPVVARPQLVVETAATVPAVSTKNEVPKALPRYHAPQPVHMQITDPATATALRDLSRFEMKTLRRQAERGDAAAGFTLGMAYESGRLVPQSCAKAATWVARSAKAGSAAAGYNLGLRYWYGDGIRANPRMARKWLRVAAGRGYLQARFALPLR